MDEWINERTQNINPDKIRGITSLFIIKQLMVSQGDPRNIQRQEKLRANTDALVKSLTGFLSRQDCEQNKIDAVLEVVADHLPPISDLPSLDQSHFADTGVFALALHLSKALEARR